MDEFDVIIVGAGSAGCALAERLSADPRRSVLLLEAGGDDRRFWITTPIGYGKAYFDASVNWKFSAEPDPGLGGRALYWPRGKVLGGSSSINAMVYSRGMPADYDDWREAGNPGWGWRDVEPVFRRFERRGDSDDDAGLWVSDRERDYHPIKRFFYAAAEEVGLRRAADVNGPDPEGVGAYQITTKRGRRCSSAAAFLRPAMARRNLEVRTEAAAHRVLFDGVRATGVEYRRRGGLTRVRARAEVILCAGAIGSPQLLQLSGVGPAKLLAEMGVGAVHANDGVGGALQDHIGLSYFYRATEPTLNNVLGTWRGRLQAGVRFVLTRSGPLSLSVNQMGGMVRTAPDKPRPDIQLYFNPLSYSTDHADRRPLFMPDRHPGFVIGFNPCRPTSLGRVDIRAPDPSVPPRIVPNYLSTPQDEADVIACARLIGRLQETSAMRGLIHGAPQFDLPGAGDDAILVDFRARCGSVYHPCGACRMAPEAQGGVVDPKLRVYGVEGLRVVDASIFPNITSANINAPTIMVAHKAADLILAG